MRRILFAAALASALTSPAGAAQMLYATAAIPNRVEGFCVATNGGLAILPVIQQGTVDNPRRLLLPNQPDGSPGNVLYVAGRHRVESFQIKVNGGLDSTGTTPRIHNANSLDIAVNSERTHLYVPNRATGRVEAYPLDPVTGALLGGDMTSCALTRADVTLQDLEVGGEPGAEVLYVTESTSPFVGGKKGRVDVFALVDGELPDLYNEFADPEGAYRCGNPDATTTSTTSSTSSTSLTTLTTTVTTTSTSTTLDTRFTETLSTRKKLRSPGPFVLSSAVDPPGQYIYVYDFSSRRIIAFALTGGLFTSDDQQRASASNEVGRFLDLVAFPAGQTFPRTLFGSADSKGRVRALVLRAADDGLLTRVPGSPQHQTQQLIESTPVRIAVTTADSGNAVLYVPGGEANRIHAYRVVPTNTDGFRPEYKAFSQTERRRATFPNDAVIAQISACP